MTGSGSFAKRCLVMVAVAATVLELALPSHGQDQQRQQIVAPQEERQGKGLLDLIGLGTGPEHDPYVARTNENCLNGDLAECFKSRALSTFDEFFDKPAYLLTENARILRMPETQLRSLAHEGYEYSQTPRSDEPEWDQLVKFAMRKVEKFLKSTAIEVTVDNEVTEHGRYSPRFVDEIADEIDLIEDKKDTLFNRKKLKKLFIPMLIILKLFKLKLLLFLPLILGLASFKKFLGFLAIVVPGAIAFFKLCKPNLQAGGSLFGGGGHAAGGGLYNSAPHYSPAGVGYHHQHQQGGYYREQDGGPTGGYSGGGHGGQEYEDNSYYGKGGGGGGGGGSSGGFTFRESNQGQQGPNLAYSGYSHYRNSNGDKEEIQAESASKKSILPDS